MVTSLDLQLSCVRVLAFLYVFKKKTANQGMLLFVLKHRMESVPSIGISSL
jgi:hypothetical protein